jgi:hypothetical protein
MPLSTARFPRHGRPRPSVRRASLGRKGPIKNPLLVGEVTGMRSSRKGHPGQNGPVATGYWLRPQMGRQIGVCGDLARIRRGHSVGNRGLRRISRSSSSSRADRVTGRRDDRGGTRRGLFFS